MESSKDMKRYHKDEFDHRLFVESFFYPTCERPVVEQLVGFPMKMISKVCSSENIGGRVMIDVSSGPIFFQMIPLCESFSEVIMLEFSDSAMKGIEEWRDKKEGAFDWCFASEFATDLKISREEWKKKEELLRSKITEVTKVSFSGDQQTDLTSLPKADCMVCAYGLHPISEDYDAYCCNIQKLASLLNPGGVLLLVGGYHASFYKLGEDFFFLLDISKEQFMKAMEGAGLTVEIHETLTNETPNDKCKFDQLMFVKAVKKCQT